MGSFKVTHTDDDSEARRGILKTSHGDVQTPVFMPVGTAGAVKGITPAQLKQTGTDMVLANTYHLILRPGVEVVEKVGGLHRFIAWDGPILTDSGGYQVFSLSELTKIDDKGVEFASHIDGAKLRIDADSAIQYQNRLGADVIMCLDHCPAFGCQHNELEEAVERTIIWAKRGSSVHSSSTQLLFGIVQGGTDFGLRRYCVAQLLTLDFDGYAIGGLGLGEGQQSMINTVSRTVRLLPEEKPRYLMGVGTPADIISAVKAGVDMFDCVLPTRNGRNAYAFTENGPVRLRNNEHIDSTQPIQPGCDCYCCTNFTRAAIRHFFNVSEMLGPILTSLHNLRFYQRLMGQIREKIEKGGFTAWADERLAALGANSGTESKKSQIDY